MAVNGFLVNNEVQKYNYESLENYNTPDFSTSSTYQVGDYVMYQGKLYKCTTVITTSGVWDSTKWSLAILSDDVADLKSALTQKVNTSAMSLCDVETVPSSANMWNPEAITSGGGILANGNFYANESYCYERIAVTPGETLYFYDLRQSTPSVQSRWICAYDANNNVVSASGSNTGVKFYTVPDGIAYLTLSTMLSYNAGFMVLSGQSEAPTVYIPYAEAYDRYVATYQFLKNIDLGTTVVDAPIYETTDTQITNTTGSMLNTGVVRTGGTYDNYQYSQKIPVSEGDVIKPLGNSGAYFRWICAYNGNTVVSGAGLTTGAPEYTVPSGIDGIIVTTLISLSITVVSIKHQTGTEVRKYPISQKLGKVNWKGNLSSGDSVELLSSNVRFNVVWAFTGHVSTMGKITIGNKDEEGNVLEICSVDSTNIYYVNPSNSEIVSAPHGLTISGDLSIRIDSDMRTNFLKGIYITSLGETFSLEDGAYNREMKGSPYLVSDGAVLTDCAFSWIPQNIDKPIWVFGDSWGSMFNTRWAYYMNAAGYTNSWMLNAFPGENTKKAFASLENLLTIRKPEYIVWMLGMNDADSGAVNANWKTVYDKLTELCEAYAINLILYTVPNTPTIDNTYKNEIVRESGYRYIDGVAAVGDDGDGNWFTGYEQSSTDHNHTSAKGAKALFHRILTDFPEIASNSL